MNVPLIMLPVPHACGIPPKPGGGRGGQGREGHALFLHPPPP